MQLFTARAPPSAHLLSFSLPPSLCFPVSFMVGIELRSFLCTLGECLTELQPQTLHSLYQKSKAGQKHRLQALASSPWVRVWVGLSISAWAEPLGQGTLLSFTPVVQVSVLCDYFLILNHLKSLSVLGSSAVSSPGGWLSVSRMSTQGPSNGRFLRSVS